MTETGTQIVDHINQSIPEIDLNMGLSENEGLQELIERSELTGSNPDREKEFLKLAQECKWVGMAPELMYLMSQKSQALKPHKPYILGISNWKEVTGTAALKLNGIEWSDGYDLHNIQSDQPQHTETYMKTVTTGNDDIVFFVPPRLYSHRVSGVTAAEMNWFLNHPDRAKHLYLVFGGYDFLRDEWFKENWLKYRQHEQQEHLAQSQQRWIDLLLADLSPNSASSPSSPK